MPLTWNWNPLIGAAILLPAWLYAHGVMHLWRGGHGGRGVSRGQVSAFSAGIIVLFIALISPVDPLGEQLLSAHMVQHILLMIAAPPLLIVGAPPSVFLWALPLTTRRTLGRWTAPGSGLRRAWRLLTQPAIAWTLHAAAIWLWHLPGLYQAALTAPLVHTLEHAAFFGTGLLFWVAALNDQRGSGRLIGALLIFTTALHSSALGALMTFAESVWYPIYSGRTEAWGLTPLEDQQLAGLIMWIPGGVAYLIGVLWLVSRVIRDADE